MKFGIRLALVAAVFACGSDGYAADPAHRSYAVFQVAQTALETGDFDEVNPTAFVARLGLRATEHVAAELRVTFNLQDDSVDIFGQDSDVEIEYSRGIYGVYYLGADFSSSIYGVLGYTEAEVAASTNGQTRHTDDRGYSVGAGINISNFNIEFMQYLREDEIDASAISIGYFTEF